MNRIALIPPILAVLLTACSPARPASASPVSPASTQTVIPLVSFTQVPEWTVEMETLQAIPTFTPLPGPCVTPEPEIRDAFINNSITIEDNGKTFITHVTSRFWIFLDDKIYPLRELLNAIPDTLIGYVSNGSIMGPQCYPIYFEAVHPGKGILRTKDFQLTIIVDNALPMSHLPLH